MEVKIGGKSGTTTQSVQVPPEVLARYNSVNAQAQSVAQTPFQQYSSDPNAFVAPLTAAQNYGLQQTSNYANAAQPGISAAENMTQQAASGVTPQSLNTQAYMNPYEANVIAPTAALMQQQFGQAQSGALGNAVQSGAFGGDRAGIANANLQQQQGLAYGQTMGNLLNQNYSQALGAAQQQQGVNLGAQQFNAQQQLAAGNQLGNLAQAGQQSGLAGAQALMGAGQSQQQTEQAGLTALYNQFLQQQSYPFQTAQFLANIAEGTGALSGQTTSTTQPMPFFSDRRLKEDIKEIGKAKNGLPIYSFRYKDDPDKLTRIGFMADEVEKKHPDAVGLAGGYKTVDYDRAARAEGGLVGDLDQGETYGRGGFDVGGFAGAQGYDPSWSGLMNAEEGMFGRTEGGLYGGSATGAPYGGKARVPQSQIPQHHMLQPAPMPHEQQGVGAQALQGLGQIEKLAGMAKGAQGLGHDLQGLAGLGSAPSAAAPPPAHADATATAQTPPPPQGDSSTPAAPPSDAHADASDSLPTDSGLAGAGDAGTAVADAGADAGAGLGADLADVFVARGGRIGRDVGGGLMANGMPSMANAPVQAQVYDAAARQNAMPTWGGPFARGGLAAGGAPAPGFGISTPSPTAPFQGPDVVSPTQDYLQGLGEAQAAQARANQVQDAQRQSLADLGVTTTPDLTPFGRYTDASSLLGSTIAYGNLGLNAYTNPVPAGVFAHGGLAGRPHRGAGGGLDVGQWNSADQEYQGGNDNSTQDTTQIGIPDEQPNVQPLKPSTPPSSGGGGGLGGVGQGIGALTGLLGLFMANGGVADKRRRRADGGDLILPDSPVDNTSDAPDPGLAAGSPYGDLSGAQDPVAISDLPLGFDQTPDAAPVDAGLKGVTDLRGAAGLSPPTGPDQTTLEQAYHADPQALAALGAGDAAASDSPNLPTGDNIPLPPERPADLGGLAGGTGAAEPSDATPGNPIVQAGQAASGAITHGVQQAGRAVQRAGQGVSSAITAGVQGAEGAFSNAVERVFPGLLHQESGTRQVGANGNVIVSPKGATGIAQVLPATGQMVAQQHGIPWDPQRFAHDPAYNANLGKLYLQDQFNHYGDISKALAAYNAGPGRLDAAIRRGGANWMAFMPRETQNYVPSILGRAMSNTSDNYDPNAADNALRIAASPRQRSMQANGDGSGGGADTEEDGGDGSYNDNYGGGAGANRNLNQQMAVSGAASQGGPNWFDQNRSWVVPLLSGLGTMASSNSRYLGSAILQGMGAGAQAYGNERQAESNLTNSNLQGAHTAAGIGNVQAATGLTGAQTADQLAASLGRAYFIMGQGPNGPIPGVHAVLNGQRVDLDMGAYRRLQRAGANVRPQDVHEMAGGAAAGFGTQSGPVGIPPNQEPRPAGVTPSAPVRPSFTPPTGAPTGAPTGVPTGAPTARGEVSYGVAYDPKDAAADGDVVDPFSQADIQSRNKKLDSIRQAAMAQAHDAPLMREQMENTAAMASQSGIGTAGAGAEWRARVINGLNTAARVAGYSGAPLSGSDTLEQLATKYRNMQSFANDRSDASLIAAMHTFPDLSMTPDAMRHVQALNMTRAQQSRDYAAFVEQWMQDNPDSNLANAQAAFTRLNPPSKYDTETRNLAGIMSNTKLMRTLRSSAMSQPAMEEGFQKRMHLPSGMSRYFTN